MTILQYKVFLTVTDTGSFTKAGEKLGYTQSAVSQMIRNLEKELDVSLLARSRGGITLTKVGEQMLVHIREIMKIEGRIREAAAAFNGLDRGTVRIGAIPSISSRIFPAIASYFKQNYPGIELILYEAIDQSVNSWLLNGDIDVGLLTFPDDQLEFRPLIQDRICVYTANDQFNGKESLSLEDLESQRFIAHKGDMECLISSVFKNHPRKPDIRYEVQDAGTLLRMVQGGIAHALLPDLALPDSLPAIKRFPLSPDVVRDIGIGAVSFDSLSRGTSEFVHQAQIHARKMDFPLN